MYLGIKAIERIRGREEGREKKRTNEEKEGDKSKMSEVRGERKIDKAMYSFVEYKSCSYV